MFINRLFREQALARRRRQEPLDDRLQVTAPPHEWLLVAGLGVMILALLVYGAVGSVERSMPPHGRAQRPGSAAEGPSLADILLASGVRMRRVAVRREQRWWRGASGAMLAIRTEDGAPVALLPGPLARYRMAEPGSGRLLQVDARRAGSLEREADFFYCPLPEDGSVGARQLSRPAFHRARADLVRMIGAGLLAGMAMLVPAVLLGAFVGQALPSGSLRCWRR